MSESLNVAPSSFVISTELAIFARSESVKSSIGRGGAAESQAAAKVKAIIKIALKQEAGKLLNLGSFIGIHLAFEIGRDVVRRFGHRHAVLFTRPAAKVNHLAAFGAERLPRVVFPTRLSAALRASSNRHGGHRSSENLRDRTSGTRNPIIQNFAAKSKGSSPALP